MAEAFCNMYGQGKFLAESAGLEPGTLNPYVVRAMTEAGLDISKNQTKSVFDFFKEGRSYNVVVTVCSKEAAERCPVFPGALTTLHWPFDDPARFTGTDEEIMVQVRQVRDAIEKKVKEFVETWPEAASNIHS
jgi:arsenate reductase